jgi:hypothetical protein
VNWHLIASMLLYKIICFCWNRKVEDILERNLEVVIP